jgi:hypothetical protein
MKFRILNIVIFISLILSSCSLAEDITPPPILTSPTSIPNTTPATHTLQPSATVTSSQTPIPPSATVEMTPVETLSSNTTAETTTSETASTTLSMEATPTTQENLVDIAGMVTIASGASIPDGTQATLLIYNTTLGQVVQTLESPITTTGDYGFTDVPADASTVFLVTLEYQGVSYDSDPIQFNGTTFQLDMPITVYETTSDLNVLSISQVHLQFDFSTTGQVDIYELYVISNPGESAVIVTTDGSSIPFIQIPEGAQDVNYQLAQGSSPLLNATNGFGMLPGASLQYAIIANFSLPYSNRLTLSQPFNLPVSSATIIVPEGVKVRSEQLTDGGTQVSQSTTYHMYQGSSLASGTTLVLTLSGMPGEVTGFVLDQHTLILIGVGAVGLILIALGIFLFFRDRRLRKLEEEQAEIEASEEVEKKDALGDDREAIMDAIIALDEQFKSGEITREAYEQRRDELKARLRNLV